MKRKMAITSLSLLILFHFAFPQPDPTLPNDQTNHKLLLDYGESVPPTSLIQFSSGFLSVGPIPNYFAGTLTLGYKGIIAVSYHYDIAFGTLIGRLIPTNQFEVRVQILEQRKIFPAVAVQYKRMFVKKRDGLGPNDLLPDAPELFQNGLWSTSYNAKNSNFGICLSASFNDKFTAAAIVGLREFVWQQSWTTYINHSAPVSDQLTGIFPLAQQTTFRIFSSVSSVYSFSERISLLGSVQSLPVLEVEPSTLSIVARDGYQSTIGLRYYISSPISLELFDHYISGYTSIRSYHHIRLGINAAFVLK